MKLSDFKYNLPKPAIAKYPVSPRDKAKLMVINRETGEIENKVFTDVANYMECTCCKRDACVPGKVIW
jgi:S-adenosylmethionine:tRNA ribosyltransferase-isomerase